MPAKSSKDKADPPKLRDYMWAAVTCKLLTAAKKAEKAKCLVEIERAKDSENGDFKGWPWADVELEWPYAD